MNYKVGEMAKLFGTEEYVKIIDIEDGVLADIHGTIISVYKIENSSKLYVDIFDGTIGTI